MSEESNTYSVVLRVRRVTYEDAYVAVPVTREVTKPHEDGSYRIDAEKLFAEALRISDDERVEWQLETSETAPHPIQGPKPEGRQTFDAFYASESP